MTSFGNVLEQLLTERGLSQNELARRLGISSAAVNLWIKGKSRPTRENVERVEDELAVDPRGSLLTAAGYANNNGEAPTLESRIRADPTLLAEDKRVLLRVLAALRRNTQP